MQFLPDNFKKQANCVNRTSHEKNSARHFLLSSYHIFSTMLDTEARNFLGEMVVDFVMIYTFFQHSLKPCFSSSFSSKDVFSSSSNSLLLKTGLLFCFVRF